VPGPEIRVRQGERLRIQVENQLTQATTVHWHGLRVPNAMDGVPFLTQNPIAPGEKFVYEFDVPDAGTYWYHPHHHSAEQVGRGLSGALIVEEIDPLVVDRDIVWVLGDWRLARNASIVNDFGNRMEVTMAGRIGNTVTINGRVPDTISVRSGERLRLRLINAAPARIFALEFKNHQPMIVALDGQPVEPHQPAKGRVVLGPAMRADLVLDMIGQPGAASPVVDRFHSDLNYNLVDFAYSDEPPIRTAPLEPPSRMRANTMPEPDLDKAERHVVTLEGGMMGGRGMMMGMMGGHGMGWSINGVAASGHDMAPMITLSRGRSCILAIRNETAWHHPIHLHGHSFRVITRNGKPTRDREWLDTVLIPPRETAEIAFVADNPGDWMFHCHILDHQDGGMMAVIRVA
jgi:FtsP/CotA-like multicopper oxidase with cupredoxin domain